MPQGGNKRAKGGEGSGPTGANFNQPPSFSGPYQPSFGQQQFPGPMQPPHQPGYGVWQHGQQQPPPYGNQPPPPHPYGQQGNMYRQPPAGGGMPQNGPPMTPDRPDWNGFRGGPPQQSQGRRPNGAPNNLQGTKGTAQQSGVPPLGGQPPSGSQQFGQWGGPQQPWAGQQWGGGPPGVWQGPHPPMPPQQSAPPPNGPSIPQHMFQNGPQGGNPWSGGTGSNLTSPARPSSRLRSSQGDSAFPGVSNGLGSPEALCKPVGIDRGVGGDVGGFIDSRHDDEGKSKQMIGDVKGHPKDDKGRGSYRCGRCGVPKKGHICPYQPKLKRRPDEPPPELRNASVQVEMDEFMTLRRLNIQIQGFPESYANDPHMSEDMVVGEPHVTPSSVGVPPLSGGLISNPGIVGSDAATGEPTPNIALLAKPSQGESNLSNADEGDVAPKEIKSTSISMSAA